METEQGGHASSENMNTTGLAATNISLPTVLKMLEPPPQRDEDVNTSYQYGT